MPRVFEHLTVFENLEISFPRGRSVFGALTFKRGAEVRAPRHPGEARTGDRPAA